MRVRSIGAVPRTVVILALGIGIAVAVIAMQPHTPPSVAAATAATGGIPARWLVRVCAGGAGRRAVAARPGAGRVHGGRHVRRRRGAGVRMSRRGGTGAAIVVAVAATLGPAVAGGDRVAPADASAPIVAASLAGAGRWNACGLGLGLMAGGAYFLPVSPVGGLVAYTLGAGLASFSC
jgi:hypothetical protein